MVLSLSIQFGADIYLLTRKFIVIAPKLGYFDL
jgi:hypothetical protein